MSQTPLLDWYFATTMVVLLSRRAAEIWELVLHEAPHARCAAMLFWDLGFSADFGIWQRLRTISVVSALHPAQALTELATHPRSFDWAAEGLTTFSIEAVAQAFAAAIAKLP